MSMWEITKETIMYLLKKFGMSQKELAESLGITYQALNMKINGHTDFTRSEMYGIMRIFKLNPHQIVYMFLTDNVDSKESKDEGDSENTYEQLQSDAC